jgi:hypothetical protein
VLLMSDTSLSAAIVTIRAEETMLERLALAGPAADSTLTSIEERGATSQRDTSARRTAFSAHDAVPR